MGPRVGHIPHLSFCEQEQQSVRTRVVSKGPACRRRHGFPGNHVVLSTPNTCDCKTAVTYLLTCLATQNDPKRGYEGWKWRL